MPKRRVCRALAGFPHSRLHPPTTATVTESTGGARTLTASIAVPGSLEVTVTCKAAGHTNGIRQVTLAVARPCSEHLGTLATGTVARSGIITEGGCEAKARRPRTASVFYARSEPHWARRHTFTLETPGWVTISLDSAQPTDADPLDTYLILLKDDDNKGTPVARNDNRSRRSTDARLEDLFLLPGSYTIEATTKQPQTAGNYDVVLKAVVSGLADSYTAHVDAPRTITFRYWPPDAQIAVKTAAAEEFGLTVTTRSAADDGYGTATIALTPRLVHDHELTVRVSSPSAAGRLISFKLTARCPAAPPVPGGPTLTTSTHNAVLCVTQGADDELAGRRQHHVTPGTLNGVLASARAAAAAERADHPTCGITANKLAAFMLSIGFREVPYSVRLRPNVYKVLAEPARSPMALARADTYRNTDIKSQTQRDRNKRLYSHDDPALDPMRAHFHPAVGLWQLDDAGGSEPWVRLNHGERADRACQTLPCQAASA